MKQLGKKSDYKMTNVHIVNHTHWDREWYFTSMDALVLSDQLFNDVIAELKQNSEASFVLDGQLSILDDFLEIYPEKLEEIQTLITSNQLFIGPWYTQTDAFFTSGESVLRNAMIGKFESKKYGKMLPIGYLPDTFGFNAQIPVILNEAGLKNVILWRGVHLGQHIQSPYFKWESMGGGSSLYALNFPQGYGTGMLLEPTLDYVEGRLDKGVDFIKQFTTSDEIMIPSGNDQLGIISDFSEKVKKINEIGKYDYQVSTYQNFFEWMKTKDLETYRGEFREPVLARVHKTIGSVRMDLKQKIFGLEAKLVHRMEPLLVIASQLGIELSNRLLLKAWKKLLECQAHDSLAGCVSDVVAKDIEQRLKEANELCDSMENIILKRIAEALNLSAHEILIVNTSPTSFSGQKTVKVLAITKAIEVINHNSVIVHTEYVESRKDILEETASGNHYIEEAGYYILTVRIDCELPGLGYKVFNFVEVDKSKNYFQLAPVSAIHMGEYQLSFENGQVNYQDNSQQLRNILLLIDEGNAGDTYDFSPLAGDQPIALNFNNCVCEYENHSSRMILRGSAKLPLDLVERSKKLATTAFNYQITLELNQNGEIRTKIEFNNSVLNHRIRLKINLERPIQSVKSAIPFGYISRKNRDVKDWEEKYAEMPVNIEPFEKVLTADTDNCSCLVYTNDSREYEYQNSSVFVTLIATTDTLGKPNLIYRPGRASGDTTKKGHVMMATPMAQLKDKLIMASFVIKLNNSMVSDLELSQWRSQLEQPSISYQRQSLNYFIYRIDNKIQKTRHALNLTQREMSVLSFEKNLNLLVSSVHNSYYGEGFVIRFENPTSMEMSIATDAIFPFEKVERVNAVEEIQPFSNKISAYGVASFYINPKINKSE